MKWNRFLLLILIAGAVFLIIVFANRPDLIENVWIWLVGLAGSIIKAFKLAIDYLKEKFSDNEKIPAPNNITKVISDTPIDNFIGTTLKVLRFSDDGETTIGLLFINEIFYSYTLEDTYRKEKVANETRIPCGTYAIDFMKEETSLTLKYRQRFPDWFKYHLHIQNVPNFSGIYIHSGGTNKDTAGCLLVSDSLNIGNDATYLSNSKNTFKKLYEFISGILAKNEKVRIIIKDETWIKDLN